MKFRARDTALVFGLWLAAAGIILPFSIDRIAHSQSYLPSYTKSTTAPAIDYTFTTGQYYQPGAAACVSAATCLTVTRASSGTNLLPTSASGFAYATFGNNIARVTLGSGLLVEEARTNQVLNSAVPVTQTTGSLANGVYTLWVNGAGSATMSSGTATGCGTGVATQGVPVNFTTTGAAGTCTVTVAGSLNAFQLELGTFGTSLVVTAGSILVRAADSIVSTVVPAFGSAITLYGRGTPLAPNTYTSGQTLLTVDNTVVSSKAVLSRTSAGIASPAWNSTNVSTGIVWSQNTSGKLILAGEAGGQSAVFGNNPLVTAVDAGVPTVTIVHIGQAYNGGGKWNGYIHRIAIWPTTRTSNVEAQMQTVANDNMPKRQLWASVR